MSLATHSQALIAHYGSVAVFVGGMVGGPILVTLGGLLTHQHLIAPWRSLASAWAGAATSNQLLYLVGWLFRDQPALRRLFERPMARRVLDGVRRRPIGFMLAYRFVMGLRALSPLLLGMTGLVGPLRFALLNAVAALVWAGAFTALGYFSGTTITLLLSEAQSIDRDLFVAALVFSAFLLSRALWRRRRAAESEASD